MEIERKDAEGFNKTGPLDDILTFYETEMIVERIVPIDLKEYGSKKWFNSSNTLQKLNMQAHINAVSRGDEFVMESFATFDKISVLVHELITSRIWKTYVFPKITAQLAKGTSLKSYITLYHELVCINLLEVMLYHSTAVEQCDTFMIDLIEYCYRRLVWLTQKTAQEIMNRTPKQELKDQYMEMEFKIAMCCLSIVRFLTDHSKSLSVSALHHLVCQTDLLCVLVPLIEIRPWIREVTKKGEKGKPEKIRQKFEKSKWVDIPRKEYSRVVKLEAQVWIAIYNLFMDEECRKKYEFNEFRKSNILRLKKYMNELLLDQIPVLNTMLRPLEELRLMNAPPVSNMQSFVVQALPELLPKIKKGRKWNQIAKYQLKNFFGKEDKQAMKKQMMELNDLYGYNMIDGLIDGFQCGMCKSKDATKRCSRCKSEWYCNRACQVRHWPDHKSFCKTIYEEMMAKKAEKQRQKDNPTTVSDIQEKSSNKPKKVLVQEMDVESTEDLQARLKAKQQKREQKKLEKKKAKQQAQQKKKEKEKPQKPVIQQRETIMNKVNIEEQILKEHLNTLQANNKEQKESKKVQKVELVQEIKEEQQENKLQVDENIQQEQQEDDIVQQEQQEDDIVQQEQQQDELEVNEDIQIINQEQNEQEVEEVQQQEQNDSDEESDEDSLDDLD